MPTTTEEVLEESSQLAPPRGHGRPTFSPAVPPVRIAPEYPSELGSDALAFIGRHISLNPNHTTITEARTAEGLGPRAARPLHGLVKVGRLNNLPAINRFLRAANERLPAGGLFACHLETLTQRSTRLLAGYPKVLWPVLRAVNFVLHRVLPKLPLVRSLYIVVKGPRDRLVSRTEALGRLYFCGFEVVETAEIQNQLYVVARKTGAPHPASGSPPGLLFRMQRVGRGGIPIFVYKLRTMHRYSEYLHRYVAERNGIEGCRVRDDFRVTRWGRGFRRLWIDEIPMLYNLLKGDLKLVGGRPLSPTHESLYPEAVRLRRRQHRPGLIPPFYADLPRTFEETVASEVRYLDAYERAPFRTDLHYFFRVVRNIATGRARSN